MSPEERQARRHAGAERVYQAKVAAMEAEIELLRRGPDLEILREHDELRRQLRSDREVDPREDLEERPPSGREVYRELRLAARMVVSGTD